MTIPIPSHVRAAAASVRTTLDRQLVLDALALYDAGYPPLQIAKRLTVGRTTVIGWRRQSGLPQNGTRDGMPRLSAGEIERTVALYEEGLSVEEVAERVGRSYSATHDRLVGAGVTLRPHGIPAGTRRATVPEGFVSTVQAAETMGITREHACRLAASGEIPGARKVASTITNGPRMVWAIPRQYAEDRRVVRLQLVQKPAGPCPGTPSSVRLVKGRQDRRLPAGPLVEWVQRQPHDETTLAELSGVPQRRLYAIREGEQKTVTLWTADRLLTASRARLEDVWPDIDELLAA